MAAEAQRNRSGVIKGQRRGYNDGLAVGWHPSMSIGNFTGRESGLKDSIDVGGVAEGQ